MSPFASDLWPFLLFAAKATVVLLAAWGLAFFLRRASSAVRHLVWVGALASLLVLPLASALLPAGLQLEVPGFSPGAASRSAPPANGPRWFVLGWGVGASAVLLRWGLAWGSVFRLRRRARTLDGAALAPFETDLERLATERRVRRAITLWVVDEEVVPLTWGLFRPVILLPASASEWSAERRRLVLAHEVAHIARWDLVSQTLAQLALALVWFHPLAWLAVRREVAERERACDDLVLAGGALPSRYASELLAMAQRATRRSWAATAMARPTELEGRLLSILAPEQARGSVRLRSFRSLLALVAVGALVVTLARFQLLVRGAESETTEARAPRTLSADSPDSIDSSDSIEGVDPPDLAPPETPLVSDSS